MYANDSSARQLAFDEFGHILYGVKKPKIVTVDNHALTQFFSGKADSTKILELLWSDAAI